MSARRLRLAVAVAALAGLVTGCGSGEDEEGGPAVLRAYVSLPLSGPAAAEGRDAADGARLALADAGDEAGGIKVEARLLDAGAPGAGWALARSAANARAASHDSTAVAYIGDFQSGATRASLPITNAVRMLQVSPASGAGDLVVAFPGSEDVSELQTTGERTFGRVIPSDRQQAAAAAAWTAELGWDRVRVRSDGTGFGESLADAFRAAAPGSASARGFAPFTYLAGGAQLAEPLGNEPVRSSSGPPRMGSDAFLSPYADRQPEAILATSAALDPSHLPPAAEEFTAVFEDEFGRPPGRFAAYGYEAMAVALDSIDRASDPTDRRAVVEAFLDTSGRESILGRYSITEAGETTLGRISGYLVRGDEARPVAGLEVP